MHRCRAALVAAGARGDGLGALALTVAEDPEREDSFLRRSFRCLPMPSKNCSSRYAVPISEVFCAIRSRPTSPWISRIWTDGKVCDSSVRFRRAATELTHCCRRSPPYRQRMMRSSAKVRVAQGSATLASALQRGSRRVGYDGVSNGIDSEMIPTQFEPCAWAGSLVGYPASDDSMQSPDGSPASTSPVSMTSSASSSP